VEEPGVLLIIKDGRIRLEIAARLQQAGFSVLQASDEAAARRIIEAGQSIALALVDSSLDPQKALDGARLPLLLLYSPPEGGQASYTASPLVCGLAPRDAGADFLAASAKAAIAAFQARARLEDEVDSLRLERDRLGGQAEAKESLMKELQHRVKNGLNLASSLLRLQMDELSDEDARKAIHDSVSRLRAIAAIYEELSHSSDLQSVDLGSYLGELSASVFKAFATEGSGISLSLDMAEALRADSTLGAYLGLILTELMTNAVKYAYPAGSGSIRVELRKTEAGALLRVSDEGPGFPPGFDPRSASSLGMTLVSMLSSQIGAELRVESGPGARITVSFQIK
jgi:two-component sensor histidine kinase